MCILPQESSDQGVATPESPAKMAATPESPAKMVATPEPPAKMAAMPEPCQVTAVDKISPREFFCGGYNTQAPKDSELGSRQLA